jgi:transposase
MSRARKYPNELIERGIRLVFESGRPIAHVAADLGLPAETLRKRLRQAEVDTGRRQGLTSEEGEEVRGLRKENAELRRANEILRSASLFFARELDPDRPKSAGISMSTGLVSGSSRSAGLWRVGVCLRFSSRSGVSAGRRRRPSSRTHAAPERSTTRHAQAAS